MVRLILAAMTSVLLVAGGVRAADVVFDPIYQGFETDTAPFSDFNGSFGVIERVGTGTGGVTSRTGDFHLKIANAGNSTTGPFASFGTRKNQWPGEFRMQAAFYLDPTVNNNWGFDLETTLKANSGSRSFYFNVRKDSSTAIPTGLYVRASRSAIGGSTSDYSFGAGDLPNLYNVTTAGWYLFEQRFYEQTATGDLAAEVSIYDASDSRVFRTDFFDIGRSVETDVKGPSSLQFKNLVSGNGLAFDDFALEQGPFASAAVPTPGAALGGLALLAVASLRRARMR